MSQEPESCDQRSELDDVLADYLRRVDLGERIGPEALIAAHPNLAGELRAYFSQAAGLENLAADDIETSPQQSCVIPFRRKGDGIEVCLITSLNTKRWIFPKGIVEPEQSLEEAALNEALEEAGLHGQIVGDSLGKYEDFKWGVTLQVTVLMMEVSECDDSWREARVRQRRWVTPEQAVELLSKPQLRQFLEAALKVIEK